MQNSFIFYRISMQTVLATLENSSTASNNSNHTRTIPVQVPDSLQSPQPETTLPISGASETQLTVPVPSDDESGHFHPTGSPVAGSSGLKLRQPLTPIVNSNKQLLESGVATLPIQSPSPSDHLEPSVFCRGSAPIQAQQEGLYRELTPASWHEQPDEFQYGDLSGGPPARSPIHFPDRAPAANQWAGRGPPAPRSEGNGGDIQCQGLLLHNNPELILSNKSEKRMMRIAPWAASPNPEGWQLDRSSCRILF